MVGPSVRGPGNRGPTSSLREPMVLCHTLGTHQVGSTGRGSVSIGHSVFPQAASWGKGLSLLGRRVRGETLGEQARSQASPGPHKVAAVAGRGHSPVCRPRARGAGGGAHTCAQVPTDMAWLSHGP